jgi:hypothetical protein
MYVLVRVFLVTFLNAAVLATKCTLAPEYMLDLDEVPE